jgi:cobalt-zinc-cadmium efflux system membrane fusion protein
MAESRWRPANQFPPDPILENPMKSLQVLAVLPVVLALALPGCEKKAASKEGTGKTTTVARVAESEWCAEHGVPEAVCTRCNKSLVAGFKQKGDWCDTHNLPKSQCIECDPSLKAKFEAMAPQK